jgi:GDPmannose 4,6-dehydratase
VNTVSTAALLEAVARRGDARLVLASSSEIFGSAGETPQRESTPIRPVTPYGVSKAAAHQLAELWRSRGVFAATAILYNHESPRRPETFVTRKITAGAARIALGLQDGLALGSLDARRDWGWAPDYVDAMLRIADADEPDDFVVATGESHTVEQFAEAALSAAGLSGTPGLITVDERFVRPRDVAEMVGDASRLRDRLGWTPTVPFEQIVAQMVEHDLMVLDGGADA